MEAIPYEKSVVPTHYIWVPNDSSTVSHGKATKAPIALAQLLTHANLIDCPIEEGPV